MNMENFMILANVRPYLTCSEKELENMKALAQESQYGLEYSRIVPDRYVVHIQRKEPMYVVDMCGGLDDIEPCDTLEDAKSHLYAAWEDAEEGEGWSRGQIEAMDYDATCEALEGIGYTIALTMAAAKTLIQEEN